MEKPNYLAHGTAVIDKGCFPWAIYGFYQCNQSALDH